MVEETQVDTDVSLFSDLPCKVGVTDTDIREIQTITDSD